VAIVVLPSNLQLVMEVLVLQAQVVMAGASLLLMLSSLSQLLGFLRNMSCSSNLLIAFFRVTGVTLRSTGIFASRGRLLDSLEAEKRGMTFEDPFSGQRINLNGGN
jgi:hypothetical protein